MSIFGTDRAPSFSSSTLTRLERVLDEQQKSIISQRDDVNTLKLQYVGLQRDIASLGSDLKSDSTGMAETLRGLAARFDESRKPNIPLIVGGFSLLPAIVGGMFYIFNGNVIGSLAPLEIKITALQQTMATNERVMAALTTADNVRQRDLSNVERDTSANTISGNRQDLELRRLSDSVARGQEADVNSLSDRGQLNARVKTLETAFANEVAEKRATEARTGAALTEIETQFKDITRYIVMLWEKLFGGRFPSDLNREVPVR